ncbi:MAG: M42 family metallopeptidase [Chloroflexota bacterium]
MTLLKIRQPQLKLLERLCAACAVSGDEGEVRKIVLEELKPAADSVKVDVLGNVLVTKLGNAGTDRLRVMLAAHMDEVGFMITGEDGEGLYRFEIVGGIDERQLPGKPVQVGKKHIPGVIGAKPIHLTDAGERKNAISLDGMRIDVGPEANKVKVGDRATFATPLLQLGPSLRSKSLDNRLGVATLIELIRNAPANVDILAAFTVQEENGLRGAQVAAYAFNPDLAIVLDATPANDLPLWDASENTRYNTRLDAGPAIYVADRGTLHDPRLVRHLMDTAEARGIPYQIRQPGGGGTDAGIIHRQRAGIPSVSVSVPHRYTHSAASLARRADWEHTLQLIHAALEGLSRELLTVDR